MRLTAASRWQPLLLNTRSARRPWQVYRACSVIQCARTRFIRAHSHGASSAPAARRAKAVRLPARAASCSQAALAPKRPEGAGCRRRDPASARRGSPRRGRSADAPWR